MPIVKLIVQRGAKRGTEVFVRREQAILGRSRSCQICIPAPQVSRQHCAIVIENGRVIVRDLGSTNGTYVNGVQVSEQELTTGDTLTVGNVVFLVQVEEPEGSKTARPGELPAVQEGSEELLEADVVAEDEAITAQAAVADEAPLAAEIVEDDAAIAAEVVEAEVVEEEGIVEAEPVDDHPTQLGGGSDQAAQFFKNLEQGPQGSA